VGELHRHPGSCAGPTVIAAYIGMAQMSYQLESERLAYEFMLERFKQKGDTKMVRRLERAPVTATGGTPGPPGLPV
jgi:hypothetical protein